MMVTRKTLRRRKKSIDAPLPTPDEIAERAAEVQREWTEETRLRRAGLLRPDPVTVPEVAITVDEPRKRAAISQVE